VTLPERRPGVKANSLVIPLGRETRAKSAATPRPAGRRPTPAKRGVTASDRIDRTRENRVTAEVDRITIRQIAQDRVREAQARRGIPEEMDYTSFRDRLTQPRPKVDMAVDSLARNGFVVSVPSPRKTGKTTLLANLGADGLGERPFLGEFPTHLPGDKSLVVINAEMLADDYEEPYERLDPGIDKKRKASDPDFYMDPYQRLHFIHAREEGYRIDLLSDAWVDRLLEYLYNVNAGWLFLDPWKNFLAWSGAGINDTKLVNDLSIRLQEIQAAAGLSLLVVSVHTPQNRKEDDPGRAKGAGELEDSVDAMWRYERLGNGGPDAPRYLTVSGRGVRASGAIDFDGHARLSFRDGTREAASVSQDVPEAVEALTIELMRLQKMSPDTYRINSAAFQRLLTGNNQVKVRKIRAAVASGKVVEKSMGPGRPTWYFLAEDVGMWDE
jgi:hypothetical protein